MPTDPDQDDRVDIDLTDVDLTDELPVLIETAVFESNKHLVAVADDDDTERTARVMALVSHEAESVDELKKDLEQRAAKIEALERDIERLSNRGLEIERSLQDKDTAIGRLTVALATAESTIKELRSAADGLSAEIAERDNRIARLLEASHAAQQAADLEAARQEIAATRAQLEHVRADAARMEQALLDKDRALAARDERIRTLQLEIQQRPGAVVQLNMADASRQTQDHRTAHRGDAIPDSTGTPALVCLTSDGPRRFALVKGTVTIGRSASCDIQILTHFVSREHARLTVSDRGSVVIEDLGSTNGVFVNSARVERQELHHGDVVTVGESQFRFLETMAH